MKRTVNLMGVILICVMLLCAANVVAYAENLMDNGDFEENLYYWDWKNAEMEQVADNPHGGEKCAKVTLTEVAGRGRYAFNFQPGVNYKVTFWTRLEKGTDTARIIIQHSTDVYGTGVTHTDKKNVTVGTEWTEISTTYCYNGDEDTGWGWVSLNWGGGKTTPVHFIDDVTIEIAGGLSEFAQTAIKKGEIAANSGLDQSTEGYVTNDAELSVINKNTYGETQGSGKIKVKKEGGYVGQEVTLKPGSYYELSCRVRTEGEVVPFNYVVDFSGNAEIKPQKTVLNTEKEVNSSWTHITSGFTYSESKEETTAIIYLSADGGKKNITYYLDDFSIIQKDKNVALSVLGSGSNMGEDKESEVLTVNLKTQDTMYNDKFIEVSNQPYLMQSFFMCNGQEFAKILGVPYSEENGVITIGEGKNSVKMRVGSKIVTKNGVAYAHGASPLKTQSGIDVPLDIIASLKGLNLIYDSKTGVLKVTN